MKNLEDSSLVNKSVDGINTNTFWGSKNWLDENGKSKLSPYFIIGGLIWLPILRLLTNGIDLLFQLAIVNVLGSLLLTYYFWDKYLDDYTFEKRSFWKPTLIFLAICGGLILLQVLTTRK
jgi:Na+/glutamate symporter